MYLFRMVAYASSHFYIYIFKLHKKLSVAESKLLVAIIDDDEEYLKIKKEYRERIESLEEQLSKDSADLLRMYFKFTG